MLTTTLLTFLASSVAALPIVQQDPLQAVKAAKVFTAGAAGVIDNGVVVWQGDTIVYVGRESDMPAITIAVEDLGDVWLVPGLIEPHCHVAGSLSDLNDNIYLTNPQLNTLEVVEPQNPYVLDGVAGGVTTALLIPGSGSNMGGQGTIVKFAGDTVEEAVLKSPGSLKIAQAGNPERWGFGVGRMLMNWNTRNTLQRGLEWAAAWKDGSAAWDPMNAHFVGLLEGTVPPSVHTQIYQVVLMTLTMQVRDLGLQSFVDHGTFDGYKTGFLAAELGVPVMNGPRQFHFDRSLSRIQGNAAGWSEFVDDGLVLGYNTDSPVIPQEELSFQAAMGVRLGHDDAVAALEGMTANAAVALQVQEQVGKLEPGLDADFVAWKGYPVDPRSFVVRSWIDGKVVYRAEEGRRF